MAETQSPTITVIITGAASRTCIESVLAQTFADFEIIVVGSMVEEFDEPRIILIENVGNANSARNIGLEKARGEYIYFIDADGMIFDNGLEMLMKAAAADIDIIHSTSFVERDGDDVKIISDRGVLSSNLYRRDFIERCQLRFPESIDDDGETFYYAADCMASAVVNVDEYFYIHTQKRLRADLTEVYVDDIDRDEIRCGFLVTSQRKKLWNAQIKLILEFARICKKYNLTWFAYGGTLLGAVRHGGYIPWDDDIDLGMFRPDYERFIEVAPRELKADYFLDVWYNYAVEGEPNPHNLPVISEETVKKIRERGWWWPIIADFIKLRDNNTSMIQWPERHNVNQGIWIDIIPLDPVPPFDDEQRQAIFEMEKELMMTVSFPDVITKVLAAGEELRAPRELLEEMLRLPFRERAIKYVGYLRKNFFASTHVSRLNNVFLRDPTYWWRTEWLRELVPMKFERISLPAPIDYADFLTARYGSWREPIFHHSHVTAYSVDIPYRDYFEAVSPGIRVHNY